MIRRALRWCLDTLAMLVLMPVVWAASRVLGWLPDESDELDPERVDQWGGA